MFCLLLCLLIYLGPFLAFNVSCINSFLFLLAAILHFFLTSLLSSAYSTLSYSVLLLFVAILSFSYLQLSISVSSVIFLIVDFRVLFCMVSTDSVRISFSFFIVGSLSFKESNLFVFFLKSILKGVANTLRSNLSGFCFWIFFSLINFLFISILALTNVWSLTSQCPTIFLFGDSMKSIWFLVIPPAAFNVQYLFAAFWKNELVTTRLSSSAKSSSLSPLSFLLPTKGPCAFHVVIYTSYSNFGNEITH